VVSDFVKAQREKKKKKLGNFIPKKRKNVLTYFLGLIRVGQTGGRGKKNRSGSHWKKGVKSIEIKRGGKGPEETGGAQRPKTAGKESLLVKKKGSLAIGVVGSPKRSPPCTARGDKVSKMNGCVFRAQRQAKKKAGGKKEKGRKKKKNGRGSA